MRYVPFYFCILSLIFLGCSDTTKKYYSSGELESEFYKDDNGFKQGEVVTYYIDGKISSRGHCLNDTFNGVYEEYYPNGQLKIQTMMTKGLQEGELLEYYDNGSLKQRSYYVGGKGNGISSFYYSNSKISLEAMIKNDTTLYYTKYDSLGNILEKKHSMYIEILSPLNKYDSIKIKEIIPGFIGTNKNPMFALIEKYGTIKTGDVPKMKLNPIDSAYYIAFPPTKDTGMYLIKTFFRAENKFHNEADTIIVIK